MTSLPSCLILYTVVLYCILYTVILSYTVDLYCSLFLNVVMCRLNHMISHDLILGVITNILLRVALHCEKSDRLKSAEIRGQIFEK